MANLNATPSCSTAGIGVVDLVYTGPEIPSSFIFQLFKDGALYGEYGTGGSSTTINDVPNDTYTAKVLNGDTNAEIGDAGSFMVSCTPTPVEPDPVETPGTVTPPAAKYMAVGGVLSNPIEYTFSFQVNDAAGVPKTNHYLLVNIYRSGETVPFASTRQRIRNGAAKVDVARFVKALVSSSPGFDTDQAVTTDPNALAGFTIGFVEYFGTTTMSEVKENTVKYAVNAALQSLDGNYVQHVVFAVPA